MEITSVEDLEVFKLAHALVLKVYAATRSFPRQETFGLVPQLRRAATVLCVALWNALAFNLLRWMAIGPIS